MLEEVLFGSVTMPGELIRIVLAFLGTAAAAYYDIYNKKNVPDNLLYGFVAVAFLANLVFFEENLFWFSIAVTAVIAAMGYLFYRLGQLGGADIFVIAAIMLLLPIQPSFSSLPFNLPFIFPVIVFSGVLFALYVMGYFAIRLKDLEIKPNLIYLALFIPYLLFAYVYVNSFLFSAVYFAFISVLLFATTFFMMFRQDIMGLLAEEVPISKVEPEDVLALEMMNKDMVEHYKIPRLMTREELERLQATKLKAVSVYTKLPPFIPFILAGMILSLVFARGLILI